MIKFFQKNLAMDEIGTIMAIREFIEEDYVIGLFQEPYTYKDSIFKHADFQWYKSLNVKDKDGNATKLFRAVTLIKHDIKHRIIFINECLINMDIDTVKGPVEVINVYFKPSGNITGELQFLESRIKRNKLKMFLIGGDINAHSPTWGNKDLDANGRDLDEFIISNNLIIRNNDTLPSFESSVGSSFIDLTILSKNLKHQVINWSIDEKLDLSDHRGFRYSLSFQSIRPCPKRIMYISNSTYTKLEKKCKNFQIKWCRSEQELDEYYSTMVKMITSTIKWKNKDVIGHKSYPWWSSKIEDTVKAVRAYRRDFQKIDGKMFPDQRLQLKNIYKQEKRKLSKMIKHGKINSWRKYVEKNDGRWGNSFKTVFHNKGNIPNECEDPMKVLKELFPCRVTKDWSLKFSDIADDAIPINEREINWAIYDTKKGRAPGADGIPAALWDKVATYNIQIIKEFFNNIMWLNYYPRDWKIGKIVLLPKPGRDVCQEGGYRPISLLSTLSKLFEKILLRRINFYIKGNIDRRQFGFREGVSTTDALERLFFHYRSTRMNYNRKATVEHGCLFIDIKGAFNNFDPLYSTRQLIRLGCPPNLCKIILQYFQKRILKLQNVELINENGAPQGSCLGPLLWNLNIEGMLDMIKDEDDILIQAFADDIVVYIKNKDIYKVNELFKITCKKLSSWASQAGVLFAHEKCSYVSSSEKILIHLDGKKIKRVDQVKYLGVIVNKTFTPKEHLQGLRSKAINLTCKLSQLYGRDWGISDVRAKEIYLQVIEPSLTYGCSAWYTGFGNADINLNTIQRPALLKICQTFRTVATASLQVLAGVFPLPIKVRELCERRRLLSTGRYDIARHPNYHPSVQPFDKIEEDPNYKEDNMFTDGSRCSEGTGAAVIIYGDNKVKCVLKSKLDKNIDNFQAEVEGIRLAVKKMHKTKQTYKIFSDSLSAIKSLCGFQKKSEYICEILEFAEIHNMSIKIGWVKAHNNDPGNEEADYAAKSALNDGKPRFIKCSKTHMKNKTKKLFNEEWNTYWGNHKDGRPLYEHAKNTSTSRLWSNFYLNQFNTGHGYFPCNFKRFGLRVINCACGCDRKTADFNHYIYNCPKYLKLSYQLRLANDWPSRKRILIQLGKKLEKEFSNRIKPAKDPDPVAVLDSDHDDND
jgi:ribonuclease HI